MTPGASDSASFDEVLELLHLGGRPIHHAVLMMIPEAWENHRTMDPARRAFYRFHASLMEPWDGPAAVAFTDGTVIGAVLDRNGLRPARYWVTDDGPGGPGQRGRRARRPPGQGGAQGPAPAGPDVPGRHRGRAGSSTTTRSRTPWPPSTPTPPGWRQGQIDLDDLPPRTMLTPQHASVVGRQRLFGYTDEELRLIVAPMARTGAEPIGSMGTDTAIAVLSDAARACSTTTSPSCSPRSPTRRSTPSARSWSPRCRRRSGPRRNLLEPSAESCRQIILPMPVIDNDDLAKLLYVNEDGSTPGFRAFAVDGLFEAAGGGEALRAAIEDVRTQVSAAIDDGADVIVLSDRNSTAELAPIPSLLLVAAVHHHLVRDQDPHPGGPGGGVGRRPRGPPHGPAEGVRGGGHQSRTWPSRPSTT